MKGNIQSSLALVFPLVLVFFALPAHATTKADQKQINTFINEMVNKHQFNKADLQKTFQQVEFKQGIIDSITKPYEALPWHRYRKLFITKSHIDNGVKFWKAHQASLARAQAEFGVPPEIIVSIIGVESRFGKFQGKHKVIDALSTLAFHYPPRAKFFRKELEQLLLLTREEHLDINSLKGSYAGAMGKPQFIPSSYRHYAVDFSHTGQRDLLNDVDDAIGSVANYFKEHGWKTNAPVAIPAKVSGKDVERFEENGKKPSFSFETLERAGIRPTQQVITDAPGYLVSLDAGKYQENWIGLNNFYVITRYNHSALYAMAVYQLSQKVAAAYQKSGLPVLQQASN